MSSRCGVSVEEKMAFNTLAIGLSTAFGYVDNINEEEFYYNTTPGTRPLSPPPSVIYYQPLPDLVVNNWRPNPLFQDPAGEEDEEDHNAMSNIVHKISKCFTRKRRRGSDAERDRRRSSSSGPEPTNSEVPRQEVTDLIAQRLSCPQDPRPEVDQSDNRQIGVQLRMIADNFRPPPENNSSLPRSSIPEITICVVVGLFIGAITFKYFKR